VYVANTQITNAYCGCVAVYGGEVSLIHNTIAQFYSLKVGSQAALSFGNQIGNLSYPLTKLEVKNCIITGWAEDALLKENSDSVAFNYHFYNSLIRMSELKDSVSAKYFEGVIRDNEKDTTLCYSHKNFKNVNPHTEDYLFDFHLDYLSKANGAADARWMLPLNREGVARDEKKLNVCRRVCGYLGTNFFNNGRTEEIKDRVLHL
jgi:hypothetical protein